ncbi:MAG TPA: hypothetical protein VG815_03635 [Chloroflexota bacterium]|nr:hypothetical protein [Chloroflexota bacterium]
MADIHTFSFDRRSIPLTVQTGIWKPVIFDAALTIRTIFTTPDEFP